MSDHDFQLKVMEALGELKTDMAAVKDHLKTLNGKVLAHEKQLSEQRGAERANKNWIGQVAPVVRYAVWMILLAITVLSLSHASLFSLVK